MQSDLEDRRVEAVARALAPIAWAALGLADTLANENRRKASLRHARAALAAADAVTAEDGWRLAPVEVTKEMIKAGNSIMSHEPPCEDVYRAMLAAAPSHGGGG